MKAGELGDFRLTCIATSVGISLPHTIGAVYSSGKLPLLPSNSPYNQPVESSEHMEVSITCYCSTNYSPLSSPFLSPSVITAPVGKLRREVS